MAKTPPPSLPSTMVDPSISIGTKAQPASAIDLNAPDTIKPAQAATPETAPPRLDIAPQNLDIMQARFEQLHEQWEDFLRDYDEDSSNIRTQLTYLSNEISSIAQQKRLISAAIITVSLCAGVLSGLIAGIAFYVFFR